MATVEKDFVFHRDSSHMLGALHDLACVFVASYLFQCIYWHKWTLEVDRLIASTIIAFIAGLLSLTANTIVTFRVMLVAEIMGRFALFWLVAYGAVYTSFGVMFTDFTLDHMWLRVVLLSSFLLLTVNRLLFSALIWRARTKGKYRRSVFLIGSASSVTSLGRRMRHYRSEGFSIAGVQRLNSSPRRDVIENIVERIRDSNASEVWISLPMEMGRILKAILYQLRNETAEVRFFPEFSDERLLNHRASEVVGRYAIDLSVTPISGYARLLKRVEDIVLGILISIAILPVCLVISLAIKLTSAGPILFTQYRTGANGYHFKVYKFRSMKVHAEEGVITQAAKDDDRITKAGSFLRRTSLDELPQLINVLQGNMSLVGPRPHALSHNDYYKNLVESYMRRHMVKPGITGWAQVSGYRGETDTLEKMQKRVEHDLWYIDNWSVSLDIKIIFSTMYKGFIHKNAY